MIFYILLLFYVPISSFRADSILLRFLQSNTRNLFQILSHLSPLSVGIASVVGIPLLLAAAYWLFVVNGPTPVVRARNLWAEEGEDDQEQEALAARLAGRIAGALAAGARRRWGGGEDN